MIAADCGHLGVRGAALGPGEGGGLHPVGRRGAAARPPARPQQPRPAQGHQHQQGARTDLIVKC